MPSVVRVEPRAFVSEHNKTERGEADRAGIQV